VRVAVRSIEAPMRHLTVTNTCSPACVAVPAPFTLARTAVASYFLSRTDRTEDAAELPSRAEAE